MFSRMTRELGWQTKDRLYQAEHSMYKVGDIKGMVVQSVRRFPKLEN